MNFGIDVELPAGEQLRTILAPDLLTWDEVHFYV